MPESPRKPKRSKRAKYAATNRHIHRFLRAVARAILRTAFRVDAENLQSINRERGPVILLGNHTSSVDPFLVAMFVNRPVHFVASDSNFRKPLLAVILRFLGTIPKTKVVSDLETVKAIVAVKQRNGIIGIFPEGQNSWDGHTLPLVPATDKLIKSLKIAVYRAQIRGSFFTLPRWARGPRRGGIVIRYDRVLEASEVRRRSLAEVAAAIDHAVQYDAYDDYRKSPFVYRGSRPAEYLERALFICPNCNEYHTLVSWKTRFSCRSCGYTLEVKPSLQFTRPDGQAPHFSNVRDWSLWQRRQYESFLAAALNRDGNEAAILVEQGVRLERGYRDNPLKLVGEGTLWLYPDRIVTDITGAPQFAMQDIDGMNVQNNEHLEFYFQNSLFRVTTLDPRGNTYKWVTAVRFIQENTELIETSSLKLAEPRP